MLRNREGFTLIELLIVVVIIGILAAIALPKFGETRERAYVSAMQSDLRNLQTAQEMYYNDQNYTYIATTLTPGDVNTDLNFSTSSGVTITTAAAGAGLTEAFQATAIHAATDRECTMVIGTDAAQGIACPDTP